MDIFRSLAGPGLIIAAYLLGSIPFGIIVMRGFTAIDPRRAGSGNIGATNVRRIAGPLPGVLTLIGDVGKGALPVCLAKILLTHFRGPFFAVHAAGIDTYVAMVASAAFIGHIYPLFLSFKDGGKGVATAAGCFLVISPIALGMALIVFIVGLMVSSRVSLGSLAASLTLPIWVYIFRGGVGYTACAGIVAMIITIRHKDNIKRLWAGTEPKFNQK